jgi:quinol monooxygenase YgiN
MQVSWWVELSVRPGCLDDFEKLTGEIVAATRAESGVLAYQRFISDDQRTVYVHERYQDSNAAIAHLRTFAAIFGERYTSMVDRKRFVVSAIRAMRCGRCWTSTKRRITGHLVVFSYWG